MPSVNKQQWLEWRENPVTRALKESVTERIEEAKDQLSDPYADPKFDLVLKGMIRAFNEVLEAKPDLIDEGDFSDEVQTGDVSSPGNS